MILPDYLRPGLRVVFVGTAVGTKSAERGHYYAGSGNDFWRFLHEAGLTPTDDDATLPKYGLGLTDLTKTVAQSHDRGLTFDFPAFTAKIQQYQPPSSPSLARRPRRCTPAISASARRPTAQRSGAWPASLPTSCPRHPAPTGLRPTHRASSGGGGSPASSTRRHSGERQLSELRATMPVVHDFSRADR